MIPPKFQPTDLSSITAEAIYISRGGGRTYGLSYRAKLIMKDNTTPYAIVENDRGLFTSFELAHMDGKFIPMTALTDKEIFIFKLSGELPSWVQP